MHGCSGSDQPSVDAEQAWLDADPSHEPETSELGQCGSYRAEQYRAGLGHPTTDDNEIQVADCRHRGDHRGDRPPAAIK